jgi:hypothetical protein
MARVILVLTAIGVTIYAAIDCLRSTETEISKLPKPLWLLVILLLSIPPIGGIAWLVVGRVRQPARPVPADHPPIVAPDDDPDFLRSLDRRRRQIPPPGRPRRPKRQAEETGEEDRPTQS